MQTSSFYLPGTSAGELAQEAMLWNEDLFFPTNSRILENLVPMIQNNSLYVLNLFLIFLSVSKIHTILYALIKFLTKASLMTTSEWGFCFSWEETISLILINSPKFRNTIIALQNRITIYISPLISNSYSYFHFRLGTDMQFLLNEIPMHWSSWSLPNTDPVQLPYLCLSHQWCIGTLLLITSAPINKLPIQFCCYDF